jgi:excisionase family DNA binding protein
MPTRRERLGSLIGPEPLVLSIAEAARSVRMGKTKMRDLIRDGRIPTVRDGRWVRVPVDGLREWVRRNTE